MKCTLFVWWSYWFMNSNHSSYKQYLVIYFEHRPTNTEIYSLFDHKFDCKISVYLGIIPIYFLVSLFLFLWQFTWIKSVWKLLDFNTFVSIQYKSKQLYASILMSWNNLGIKLVKFFQIDFGNAEWQGIIFYQSFHF